MMPMKLSQVLLLPVFLHAIHLANKSKKYVFFPELDCGSRVYRPSPPAGGFFSFFFTTSQKKSLHQGNCLPRCKLCLSGRIENLAQLWPLRTGFGRSSCRTGLKELWFQDVRLFCFLPVPQKSMLSHLLLGEHDIPLTCLEQVVTGTFFLITSKILFMSNFQWKYCV